MYGAVALEHGRIRLSASGRLPQLGPARVTRLSVENKLVGIYRAGIVGFCIFRSDVVLPDQSSVIGIQFHSS